MTSGNILPLVTISIPAYKTEYLKQSIESALHQTYTNFELIIVDDNSPYNIENLVKQYNDKRIKYYRNIKNLGRKSPVANWNQCIRLAQGKYFVLLCDDDVLMPNFLLELLSLAHKYPSCNVFHARRRIIDKENNCISEDNEWAEWEDVNDFYCHYQKGERHHTISEFLYRTNYIKKILYVDFPLAWGSDDISIINFAKEGGIASSNQVLAQFRINDLQLSKPCTHILQKAKARIKNKMWLAEYFCGNRYDEKYMQLLGNQMVTYIQQSPSIYKILLLYITPKQVFNLKQKCKLFWKIISGKLQANKDLPKGVT